MAQNHTEKDCPCPLDRLSNLPSGVLGEIFKLLPLHDVVRTSILSRVWRYKWVACPHLLFNTKFCDRLSKHHQPELVVYRTLVLHKEPIVKFACYKMPGTTSADVDCWLHLLSNRNVEDLTLPMDYVLPRHFYDFDNLKSLKFGNVELGTPLDFKGFNKLVDLHLYRIRSKPEQLIRFLSKCPMLESLTILEWQETSSCFSIEAPNLKYFEFWGQPCLLHLHCTSLEELSVGYNSYHHLIDVSEVKVGKGNWIRVFGELPSIKRLKLDDFVCQLIAKAEILQEQENVNDLTDLTFDQIASVETNVVILALCLIKSSPNLQRLSITFNIEEYSEDKYDRAEYVDVIEYAKAQQKCEVSLKHLKSVEIVQFTGHGSEMEFLKLLLQWATRLEKLEIKCVSKLSIERKFNAVKELARLSHSVLIFE